MSRSLPFTKEEVATRVQSIKPKLWNALAALV